VAKSDRLGVWGEGRRRRLEAPNLQPASRENPPRGFSRHFEGWQPGLVAVALAGIVAILAVPRSVEPAELPLPMADVQQLRRIALADDAAARSILRTPLDADVRALGSLLRAFGKADAVRDDVMLAQLRSRISTAVVVARTQGDASLVGLRAFQLNAFLREVRHFVATGESSTELIELGGSFADVLVRNGWCVGAPPCVMHMGEHALRAIYKRRWNEISGLSGDPFDLTLDEQRAFYEFLLRYPPQKTEPGSSSIHRFDGPYLLRKVDELAAIDATYPRQFARGIIQFRTGDFRRAAQSFSAHLDGAPDGPWAIRAQNHLRAALERSFVEPP
jgi:hypothetical protein